MLNIRDLGGLAGRAGPARPKAPPTASAPQHPYLRNYLKIAIATAGDTRAGHRPVAAGPGSCWPASRSTPVSPDTWTATPKSVPPPNAAPESASRHPGPTSPPQCAEYAADTRTPPPPGDQQDCHTPCPGTSWAQRPRRLPGTPLRCAPRSAPAVWRHAHWPQAQPRSRGRHAPVGEVRANGIPPNAPCPTRNRPTAVPTSRRPTRRIPPPEPPGCGGRRCIAPSVGKYDGWRCHRPVPGAKGSLLATATPPEDDGCR